MSEADWAALVFPRLPEMRGAEENWTGKTKSSDRKKLQNRLNQRALRKRRATDVKGSSTQPASFGQQQTSLEPEDAACVDLIWSTFGPAESQIRAPGMPLAAKPPCVLGLPQGREALTSAVLSAYGRYRRGEPDPRQLINVLRFNVFYAFAHNARILGFNDNWLKYEAVSPLCQLLPGRSRQSFPAEFPPNMTPTELQMTVEHHPWIDFLPCPRMRDNFLRFTRDHGEDAVDEDGLCSDIVDAASARGPEDVCLVTWGKPWELKGWEFTESFLKKWAWLLEDCTELLQSTNYWREKRGLNSIRLIQKTN